MRKSEEGTERRRRRRGGSGELVWSGERKEQRIGNEYEERRGAGRLRGKVIA